MKDKKLAEYLHVRFLDSHLHVLPDAVWDEDGESPDFVLTTATGVLGIEVTELHSDPAATAREREQELVLQVAHTRYSARGGPPTLFRVYWNNFEMVTKSQRLSLAEEMANAAFNLMCDDRAGGVLDRVDDLNVLPRQIDRLDASRYDEDGVHSDWTCVRVGFPPIIDAARITDEIAGKDKLSMDFRPTDDLWLVLVLGMRMSSTWGIVADSALTTTYSSCFRRIFLVWYAPRIAQELHVNSSWHPSNERCN